MPLRLRPQNTMANILMARSLSLAYPGYQYDYSVDAKLLNDREQRQSSRFAIRIRTARPRRPKRRRLAGTSWATYSGTVTIPGLRELQFTLTAEDGSVLYDNGSVKFKGRRVTSKGKEQGREWVLALFYRPREKKRHLRVRDLKCLSTPSVLGLVVAAFSPTLREKIDRGNAKQTGGAGGRDDDESGGSRIGSISN
jgi:hypothetical protein